MRGKPASGAPSMQKRLRTYLKWLSPGLHIKRWLLVLFLGVTILSLGVAQAVAALYRTEALPEFLYIVLLRPLPVSLRLATALLVGLTLIGLGLRGINRAILRPYQGVRRESVVDVLYSHQQRQRGPKVVAIGGGTGLPSVLRGMKHLTNHLTAIVTVADDGGSSGRLRRELGVLPPGDLRNNIAALANDEHLMTQLFQYRFNAGDLDGHSFGNLFLTALSDITGGMDQALIETARVLAIQGSVLPATLDNVSLCGEIRTAEGMLRTIEGEAEITAARGRVERVFLEPSTVRAYPPSVQAILSADLVVLGPGSLFTSILPSLLIDGIVDALRASKALRIYVCNVATQPGETDGFNVADHVRALEKHLGRNAFDLVVANNHFPANPGEHTLFVQPASREDDIAHRYEIVYADLTDSEYPWRHDPDKLARVLQTCFANYQASFPARDA